MWMTLHFLGFHSRPMPCIKSLVTAINLFNFVSDAAYTLKGAMSPLVHGRANENKLEKVNPTFSSSVEDFRKLFSSVSVSAIV